MLATIRPALTLVLGFTLLLGLAAPLTLTGIAGALLPGPAAGSLVERNGVVLGSVLVGQAFAGDRYVQPRPSGAGTDGYDASASAASQLGPTSAKLLEAVRGRVEAAGPAPVPADAVTSSGSGLDPHVSPATALRQVARIATARGLPAERVRALIEAHVEGRELGILGEPRVNVLRVNLALDALG